LSDRLQAEAARPVVGGVEFGCDAISDLAPASATSNSLAAVPQTVANFIDQRLAAPR